MFDKFLENFKLVKLLLKNLFRPRLEISLTKVKKIDDGAFIAYDEENPSNKIGYRVYFEFQENLSKTAYYNLFMDECRSITELRMEAGSGATKHCVYHIVFCLFHEGGMAACSNCIDSSTELYHQCLVTDAEHYSLGSNFSGLDDKIRRIAIHLGNAFNPRFANYYEHQTLQIVQLISNFVRFKETNSSNQLSGLVKEFIEELDLSNLQADYMEEYTLSAVREIEHKKGILLADVGTLKRLIKSNDDQRKGGLVFNFSDRRRFYRALYYYCQTEQPGPTGVKRLKTGEREWIQKSMINNLYMLNIQDRNAPDIIKKNIESLEVDNLL